MTNVEQSLEDIKRILDHNEAQSREQDSVLAVLEAEHQERMAQSEKIINNLAERIAEQKRYASMNARALLLPSL